MPAAPPSVALFLGFDVRIKGGLITMVESFLAALEDLGIRPLCFMPSLTPGERLGFGVRSVVEGGRPWLSVGTVPRTPNAAGPLYPAAQLRSLMRGFDLVQAVVGGGAWALPAVMGTRSVAWVATPFEEELRSRVHAGGALRKAWLSGLVRCENAAEGAVLRRCDRVLALSQNTRAVLMRRHHLREDRLGVLYAPIDDRVFHPAPEACLDEVLVTTSRLDDERKDIPTLIRAFALVARERPRARLKLLGPWLPGGPVDRALSESGLRDRVDTPGLLSRADVAAQLRQSSVFVLSSRQEGLGIVALEAMACGLPVVALSNGGTDEIITDSGAGTLLQGRDEAALARAMVALLTDPGTRERMRQRALGFVQHRASRQVFAATIAATYQALGLRL